ncbi:MAG: hypothetical protein JW729_10605 [Bacteroidales bacterium]|nr:hypothetical protein [Bacteroidales bacterium]
MEIYINGIGAISPQETRDNANFLTSILEYKEAYLPIAEPPYKDYINPKELRRMSKIIRNGITAARISLEDSELEMPDAILTGTGLGCAVDTEKFLLSMIDNQETLLTPTSFIQSTHNTVGGAIAIGLGCHNYNMTYVHRGFSFETALHDAFMMMHDGEIENALVGGFDEMTDNHIQLLRSVGHFQPVGYSNLDLKNTTENGTIAGQGASFFVLEKERKRNSYAKLINLKMFFKPESTSEIVPKANDFLAKNQLSVDEIDLVLIGYNGIQEETDVYNAFTDKLFPHASVAYFKHLCGEYYTASAFGSWIAAQILQKQEVPDVILYSQGKPKQLNTILLYNQFQEEEHSFILFSKC